MTRDPSTLPSDDGAALDKVGFFDALEESDQDTEQGFDQLSDPDGSEPWDEDEGDAADQADGLDSGFGPAGGARYERPSRRRSGPAHPHRALLAVIMAWLFGLIGVALGLLSFAAPSVGQPIMERLQAVYLTPPNLVIIGLIFGMMGTLRRHLGSRPLDAPQSTLEFERLDRIDEAVDYLVENAGQAPNQSLHQEFSQVLVALQRQDEKINNLTRATKMYGKPLIEISTQVSELCSKTGEPVSENKPLQELWKSLVVKLNELEQNLVAAMEHGAGTETLAEQVGEVLLASRKTAATLEKAAGTLDKVQTSLVDDMPQRWEEIRRHVADSVAKLFERDPHAGRTDGLEKVDQAVGSLKEQLNSGLVSVQSGLKSAVDALQGELKANLGTLQGELKSAVGSLQGGLHTITETIADLEVAAAPGGEAAGDDSPKKKKAAVAKSPTSAPAKGPDDKRDCPAGLAQSIAGARKASGKNVLGAIAKLKQMRN